MIAMGDGKATRHFSSMRKKDSAPPVHSCPQARAKSREGAVAFATPYHRMVFLMAVVLVAALIGACGGNAESNQAGLRSDVSAAMAGLPYPFRFIGKGGTSQYVLFHVADLASRASVNIAYGGSPANDRCPRPPRLPVKHRRGPKPFSAAGPEPLICLEADAWRPGSAEPAANSRGRIVYIVAEALCEEVYTDGFTCFD